MNAGAPILVHMECRHADTRMLLRQSMDMLGKLSPDEEPD